LVGAHSLILYIRLSWIYLQIFYFFKILGAAKPNYGVTIRDTLFMDLHGMIFIHVYGIA